MFVEFLIYLSVMITEQLNAKANDDHIGIMCIQGAICSDDIMKCHFTTFCNNVYGGHLRYNLF